jgi:hypothetical protein
VDKAKLVVALNDGAWFQCGCQMCGMWFMAKIHDGEYVPMFCGACLKRAADKST